VGKRVLPGDVEQEGTTSKNQCLAVKANQQNLFLNNEKALKKRNEMKKIERKFTSNKHSEPPVGDPTC
jgi:hypothetical protein